MAIRNGMSEKEAGRLGALASKETQHKQKEERIEKYNQNPSKCLYCGSSLPYSKRYGKFCCKSHAVAFNNSRRNNSSNEAKNESIKQYYKSYIVVVDHSNKRRIVFDRNNLSEDDKDFINEIYKNKNKRIKISEKGNIDFVKREYNKIIKTCKFCGAEKGHCKDLFACSKHQLIKSLVKFGFDITAVGTERYVDEFYRIRTLLEKEYRENRITDEELKEKYGYTSGGANFHKILHSLDIKTYDHSDASRISFKIGRLGSSSNFPENTKFVQGKHITWNNKEVYLRSSFEFDYAKILDEQEINYEVEFLRIEYFDSQKNQNRIAVPDFYLPDTNEIIEIKSTATLDLQNMKDKFDEYKKLRYKPKLVLNHVEVDIDKVKDILTNKEYNLVINGGIFKQI